MTKIRTIILSCACLLGMAAMTSCTEGGDDKQPTLVGSSFFLPNSTEETVTVTMDFDGAWQISNNTSTWFSVSPLSGEAGSTDLTFTVFETNPDLSERVGGFVIEVDGVGTQYYVIQDVTPGFNAPENASVSGSEQEFVLNFYSNIEFEATTDADWITIGDIAYEVSTLADGVTESKYRAYSINLSIAANDGEVRDGVITLTGNDDSTSATVTLSQMGELVADYSAEFLKRSTIIKFTGTWCVNCPTMSEGMHAAMDEDPDHIIGMNFHISSDYGMSSYRGAESYFVYYFPTYEEQGVPQAVQNNYALVQNYGADPCKEWFIRIAQEASENLPANTVLGGSSTISGTNMDINLSIASKEAGDYRLDIFILEDGMIHPQTGAGSNYEHNDVVRAEITEMWGEPVTVEANGKLDKTYSVDLTQLTIENQDNLHVVAIMYKEGTYTGNVDPGYVVYNDWGYYVDNAVNIPVNGFTLFGYEN